MTAKKEPLKVIVTSYKRAGRVTTHKRLANCWLCCEEREVDAYVSAHPEFEDRVIPHPDGFDLMETRRWVWEEVTRKAKGPIFEIDDDAVGCYRIYRRPGAWKKAVLSRQMAYDVIARTAETCEALGAYLFGFASHPHPLTYDGLRPFKFGGYSPGGAVGSLPGLKFHFPSKAEDPEQVSMTGLDYWVCALNAYYHRYAFYDLRFAWAFHKTYAGVGGTAEERGKRFEGEDPEVAATKWLQKMFGANVIQSVVEKKGTWLTTHRRNTGRRQLHMPYRV